MQQNPRPGAGESNSVELTPQAFNERDDGGRSLRVAAELIADDVDRTMLRRADPDDLPQDQETSGDERDWSPVKEVSDGGTDCSTLLASGDCKWSSGATLV
jgi:hypothetical protein